MATGNLNKVCLMGRLGADPELRTIGNGTSVCSFNLATSERYKSGDEWLERTEWHRIVVWEKLADRCGGKLQKGSMVYLEGSLKTRKWEKDGVDRYTTEIVARFMEFIDGYKRSEYQGGGGGAPAGQEQPPASSGGGQGGGAGKGGGGDDDDFPF